MVQLKMEQEKRTEESRDHSGRVEEKEQEEKTEGLPQGQEHLHAARIQKKRIIGRHTS